MFILTQWRNFVQIVSTDGSKHKMLHQTYCAIAALSGQIYVYLTQRKFSPCGFQGGPEFYYCYVFVTIQTNSQFSFELKIF